MKMRSGTGHGLLVLVLLLSAAKAEEGMYPLSEIGKLDLAASGLSVTGAQIYNPGTVSLIDAIVKVGGCTGSFVSRDGLIITNHHCAFGAVQAASSKEHDYITDGFLARTRSEEIRAKGLTVRITESYRDVSAEVLSVVHDTMGFASRSKAIERKIKELETAAEQKGKRVEIAEMFPGKAYTMFIYTFMRDVRLVYVPPRAIGEFGGEEDNWVWPRHTGDFSFLRCYVAPDGSPADYAPENVPYHPGKFLKINPDGVEEHDPVFILGYPGRTYRHRTSSYLSYEENVRMPYVADLNDWMITTMEQAGKADRSIAIKFDSRIKSLANVMKNYRGKLIGMQRLQLADKKRQEEEALQNFINGDAKLRARYGHLLKEIDGVYDDLRRNAQYELTLQYLRSAPARIGAAFTVFEAGRERAKPDLERESAYMDRNYSRTLQTTVSSLRNYFEETDKVFLREMLTRALNLPAHERIAAIDSMFAGGRTESDIRRFVDRLYANSTLNDSAAVAAAFAMPAESLAALRDPVVGFVGAVYPAYVQLREDRQRRDGELTTFSAQLADVKELFMKKKFIPDANSTLRLTFGRIRGYSPADALYAAPMTSVRGVLEKTTGREPFNTPPGLIQLYKAKDFGRFRSRKLKDIPVALLYDLDTTGGNSGSPLLDAHGALVGVNFDRAFEATINDYAWSEQYSRSIGVDIRYVLWVTGKFAGATHLLDEMGVN